MDDRRVLVVRKALAVLLSPLVAIKLSIILSIYVYMSPYLDQVGDSGILFDC